MSDPRPPAPPETSPEASSKASIARPPGHLTERQIAAALLPGAAAPACPVPGCTACPARLAEAQRVAQQFHDEVLPRTLPTLQAAEVKPRLAPRGFFISLLRPWPAVGLLAAAAALLLWVKLRPGQPGVEDGPDAPYVGVKDSDDGGAAAYVRRGARAHLLADGDTVHPGDAIRFTVDPGRAKYALVVSIDGAQQISVYYPFGGQASAPVPKATTDATADAATGDAPAEAAGRGQVELPGSVVLDDTLGTERLWIVLGDAPLAVSALRPRLEQLAAGGAAAVRAAGAEQLIEGMPGVRAVTLLLHKVAPPP